MTSSPKSHEEFEMVWSFADESSGIPLDIVVGAPNDNNEDSDGDIASSTTADLVVSEIVTESLLENDLKVVTKAPIGCRDDYSAEEMNSMHSWGNLGQSSSSQESVQGWGSAGVEGFGVKEDETPHDIHTPRCFTAPNVAMSSDNEKESIREDMDDQGHTINGSMSFGDVDDETSKDAQQNGDTFDTLESASVTMNESDHVLVRRLHLHQNPRDEIDADGSPCEKIRQSSSQERFEGVDMRKDDLHKGDETIIDVRCVPDLGVGIFTKDEDTSVETREDVPNVAEDIIVKDRGAFPEHDLQQEQSDNRSKYRKTPETECEVNVDYNAEGKGIYGVKCERVYGRDEKLDYSTENKEVAEEQAGEELQTVEEIPPSHNNDVKYSDMESIINLRSKMSIARTDGIELPKLLGLCENYDLVLQNILEEHEALKMYVSKSKDANQELLHDKSALIGANEKLKSITRDQEKVMCNRADEVEDLQRTLSIMEEENFRMKDEHRSYYDNQRKESNQAKKTISTKDMEIISKNNEVAMLTSKLESAQGKIEFLEGSTNTQKRYVTILRDGITQLTETIDNHDAVNLKERERLQTELVSSARAITKMKQQHRELESELDFCKHANNSAMITVENTKEKHSENGTQVRTVEFESKIKEYRFTIKCLQEENSIMQDSLKASSKFFSAEVYKASNVDKENNSSNNPCGMRRNSPRSSGEEAPTDLKEFARGMEEELIAIQGHYEKMQKEVRKRFKQLAKCDKELRNSTREVDSQKLEISGLSSEINELKLTLVISQNKEKKYDELEEQLSGEKVQCKVLEKEILCVQELKDSRTSFVQLTNEIMVLKKEFETQASLMSNAAGNSDHVVSADELEESRDKIESLQKQLLSQTLTTHNVNEELSHVKTMFQNDLLTNQACIAKLTALNTKKGDTLSVREENICILNEESKKKMSTIAKLRDDTDILRGNLDDTMLCLKDSKLTIKRLVKERVGENEHHHRLGLEQREKISQFAVKIESLSIEYRSQVKKNESQQLTMSQMSETTEELLKANQISKHDVATKVEEIVQQEENNAKLQDEVLRFQNSAEEAYSMISGLEDELSSANVSLNSANDRLEESKDTDKQISVLRDELIESEKNLFVKESEFAEQVETILRDSQLAQEENEVQLGARQGTILSLENALVSQKEMVASQQTDIKKLTENMEEVLHGSKEKMNELRREGDEKEKAIEKLEVEIKENYQVSMEALREELDRTTGEKLAVEGDLKRKLSSLQEQKKKQDSALSMQLRTCQETISKLKKDATVSRDTASYQQMDITKLTDKIEEILVSSQRELESMTRECLNNNKKLAQQDRDILTLQEELDSHKKMKSSLNVDINELRKRLLDTKVFLEETNSTMNQLEIDNDNNREKHALVVEELKGEILEAKEETEKLKAVWNTEMKEQLSKRKAIEYDLNTRLNANCGTIESLESTLTAQKKTVINANADKKELTTLIESLQIKILSVENMKKSLDRELGSNLETSQKKIESMMRTLALQKETISSQRSDMSHIAERAEEQLVVKQDEIHSMKEESMAYTKKVAQQERDICTLKEELDFHMVTVSSFNIEIFQLKDCICTANSLIEESTLSLKLMDKDMDIVNDDLMKLTEVVVEDSVIVDLVKAEGNSEDASDNTSNLNGNLTIASLEASLSSHQKIVAGLKERSANIKGLFQETSLKISQLESSHAKKREQHAVEMENGREGLLKITEHMKELEARCNNSVEEISNEKKSVESDLNKKLTASGDMIDSLESTVTSQNSVIEDHNLSIVDLNVTVEDLQMQHSTLERAHYLIEDELGSKLETGQKKIDSMKKTLSSQKLTIASQRSDITRITETLEAELMMKQAEMHKMKEEVLSHNNNISKQEKDSDITISSLEASLNSHKTTATDLKESLFNTRSLLDETMLVMKQLECDQSNERERHTTEIEEVREECVKVTEDMAKQEANHNIRLNETLRENKDREYDLNEKQSAHSENIKSLESTLASQKDTIVKLVKNIDESSNVIEGLQTHNSSIERRNKFLEEDLRSKLDKNQKKNASLKKVLASNKETIASLKSDIVKITESTEEQFESKQNEIHKMKDDANEYKRKLAQLEKDSSEIVVSLEESLSSRADIEDGLRKTLFNNNTLLEETMSAIKELERANESERESHAEEIDELKEELVRNIEECQKEKANFSNKLKGVKISKKNLTHELTEQLNSSCGMIESLQYTLKAEKELVAGLKLDVKETNREIEELQAKNSSLENSKRSVEVDLVSEVEKREKKIESLKTAITSLKGAINLQKLEIASSTESMEYQIGVKQDELQRTKEESMEYAKTAAEQEKGLLTLREESEFHKMTIDSLNCEMGKLKDSIHTASSLILESTLTLGQIENDTGKDKDILVRSIEEVKKEVPEKSSLAMVMSEADSEKYPDARNRGEENMEQELISKPNKGTISSLESALSSHKAKVSSLRVEVAHFTEAMEEKLLSTQLELNNAQHELKKSEVLKQEISEDLGLKIDFCNGVIETLEESVSTQERKITDRDNRIEKISIALDDSSEKIQGLEDSISKQEIASIDRDNKIGEMSSKLDERSEKIQVMEEEVNNLEQKCISDKVKHEEVEANLQAEVLFLEKLRSENEHHIQDLKSNLTSTEAILKKQVENIVNMKHLENDLTKKMKACHGAIESLTKALKAEKESTSSLKKQTKTLMETVQQQAQRSQEQIGKLAFDAGTKSAQVTKQVGTIHNFKKEIASCKKTIADLELTIFNVKEQLQNTSSAMKLSANEQTIIITKQSNKIISLNDNIERTECSLKEAQNKITLLTDNKLTGENVIDSLRQEVCKITDDKARTTIENNSMIEKIQEEANERSVEIGKLCEDIQKLKGNVSSLETANIDLIENLSQTKEQLEDTKKSLEESERETDKQESTIKDYEANLSEAKEQIGNTTMILHESKMSLRQLEDQYVTVQEENNVFKDTISLQSNNIVSLQSDSTNKAITISVQNETVESQKLKLENLNEAACEKDEQLLSVQNQLNETVSRSDRDLKAMKNEVSVLTGINAAMVNDLSTSGNDLEKVRSEIDVKVQTIKKKNDDLEALKQLYLNEKQLADTSNQNQISTLNSDLLKVNSILDKSRSTISRLEQKNAIDKENHQTSIEVMQSTLGEELISKSEQLRIVTKKTDEGDKLMISLKKKVKELTNENESYQKKVEELASVVIDMRFATSKTTVNMRDTMKNLESELVFAKAASRNSKKEFNLLKDEVMKSSEKYNASIVRYQEVNSSNQSEIDTMISKIASLTCEGAENKKKIDELKVGLQDRAEISVKEMQSMTVTLTALQEKVNTSKNEAAYLERQLQMKKKSEEELFLQIQSLSNDLTETKAASRQDSESLLFKIRELSSELMTVKSANRLRD